MSFNSTEFVVFFLAVTFVHWAIARVPRARFLWLLAASCVFYMSWNAKFVALIVASSLLDYGCGLALWRVQHAGRRKLILALSLCGNLGLLGFFKYFNFFAENVAASCARLGFERFAAWVPWEIVLPAGISFYTFQTLSYTIDVYRRQLEPTRSLLEFMLFVTFFPQLVAGPIVRAADFLPQLGRPARYDEARAARGLFLIACGLAKKVLLADTIGLHLVEPIFAEPSEYGALGVVVGTWSALFQFYLDFSAYSDIAIGAAALLGFELALNFDRPFLAQSISEFWRRWHISLSTWFRDYVFLPLGGRGAGRFEFLCNIMATMLLTGLWHGAGWNYVMWGAMHGVFTFVGVAFRGPRSKEELAARPLWERVLRRAWVFQVVALSMLFFRNGTLAEGKHGIAGSLSMLELLVDLAPASVALSSAGLIALSAAALIHFTPKPWIHEHLRTHWMRLPAPAQAFGLCTLTGALAALSYAKAPFIYFQF
jgi:D-alanyl-lipoteichoic acid acyltransferase DltB (MBOAT superfamily)